MKTRQQIHWSVATYSDRYFDAVEQNQVTDHSGLIHYYAERQMGKRFLKISLEVNVEH